MARVVAAGAGGIKTEYSVCWDKIAGGCAPANFTGGNMDTDAVQVTSRELIQRLMAYRFANGDIAHRRGCQYNDTLVRRDCTCGLRELNDEIDRWLMVQEASDGE